MQKTSLIEVKNLTFEYPNTRALDNISFNLAQHSITALVGPNGAGKSTLLRCIAALEAPLSGLVLLNGQDVLEDPRASHRQIGYLSDSFGLYNALTVKQCLEYAARAQGIISNVNQIVLETAQTLGLSEKINTLTGALSRGQRQRVALGQSIIHSPSLLLLDEPASGLDPEARYNLSQIFIALKNSGMTLIVSSHILAELEDYSTDMLVLKDGKILQQQAVVIDANQQLINIAIELVHIADAEKLHHVIKDLPSVHLVDIASNIANIQLDEALLPRWQLLKLFADADIAINEFSFVESDMQKTYLKAVNAIQ